MTGRLVLVLAGLAGGWIAAAAAAPSEPAPPSEPAFWAVLVAGSKGWENYRHQADVCHAYQLLVAKGVPKDRIITLMYDDIANNNANPHKGVIINEPNGTNLYEGVQIDYRGDDVSVDTFRQVLLGNATALKGRGTGRVLQSGANDHVFINFVDHGGRGLLSFPNERLFAKDLTEIINGMEEKKLFGKLLLFVEACEAGSMFDNILKSRENVLATTASAPDESSWGWYCDTGNCLGDLYSITWMKRLAKLDTTESLFEHFDAVRSEVLQKSHVNLYGDYELGHLQFGKFTDKVQNIFSTSKLNVQGTGVDNRDVPIYMAKRELELSRAQQKNQPNAGYDKEKKLENLLTGRLIADNIISRIVDEVTKGNEEEKYEMENDRLPLNLNMFPCYKKAIAAFDEHCFDITQHYYFLKHMYKFANMCVKQLPVADITEAIHNVCSGVNYNENII